MKRIVKKLINDSKSVYTAIISILINRGMLNWMPDESYIKLQYRSVFHKKLNLANPVTLNEKLQWIKLYDRRPLYTQIVDKYEVRNFVKEVLSPEYLIGLIGVYDSFSEIDIASLPDQFVIKCTHDSKSTTICKDKKAFDFNSTKRKIERALNTNFYYWGREWAYKNVKPRIIIERYITDNDTTDELSDYKFYCFNGIVDCVLGCYERESGEPKYYFFDREWNLKRYNKRGKAAPANFTMPKPANMDKMFDAAEALAKAVNASFLRVDLYNSNGKIYFGELTLYPASGLDNNRLPEIDEMFGNMTRLPKRN